jgi:uncharacterized protein
MITVASHECRTILGRLDRGVDLIDGLLEVCRQRQVRTGTVVALGAMESVEVAHYDVANKRYRAGRNLEGPLEILSAVGNLSERKGELALHLHITLSREGDNGVEVLGGHVVSGEVFACEFSITVFDDVMLRRGKDSDTGLPLWKEGFERDDPPETATPVEAMGRVDSSSSEGEPAAVPHSEPESEPESESEPTPKPKQSPAAAAKPAKAKPAKVKVSKAKPAKEEPSWADVAAASEQAQAGGGLERPLTPPPSLTPEPEEEDEPEGEDELDYVEVEPGDYVDHPRFKRCKVARVEGDMEYVQVRLRNGNIVRLSLDIVTLVLVGSEDGHQVFQAIIDS